MIKLFRTYQKYVFWGVVLFILPTFSISFVMFQILMAPDAAAGGVMYGEELNPSEFQNLQRRLERVARFDGQRIKSPRQYAWSHLAKLKKAEQYGIAVTDTEVSKTIQTSYRERVAGRRAIRAARTDPSLDSMPAQFRDYMLQNAYDTQYKKILPTVTFNKTEYEQLLSDSGVTLHDYETTVEERLRIDRLRALAISGVKADPTDLYAVYQQEHHERRARYIVFDPKSYVPTRDNVTEEELQDHYDEHKDKRFSERKQIDVTYVVFPYEDFDAAAEAPTEEALRARYELVKQRFRLPDAPKEESPEGEGSDGEGDEDERTAPPAPKFKAFEDVKDTLEKDLRRESARKIALARTKEARDIVEKDLAAGKDVDLVAFGMAHGATVNSTGLIHLEDLAKNDDLASFFTLASEVDAMKETGTLSQAKAGLQAALFYQLVALKEAREIPFAEAKEAVIASFVDSHEDDLRELWPRMQSEYREPEKVELQWAKLLYRGNTLQRMVPEEVTGEEREKRIKEEARNFVEKLATGVAKVTLPDDPDDEAVKRDFDEVALDLGGFILPKSTDDDLLLEVTATGDGLPDELKGNADIEAYVAVDAKSTLQQVSEPFEIEGGLVVFFPKRIIAPKAPIFAEVRDRLVKDLGIERGKVRAKTIGEAAWKRIALRPASLVAEAETLRLEVMQTELFEKTADGKDLPNDSSFVSALFGLGELGDVTSSFEAPTYRPDEVIYVVRWTEREAANPAEFDAKRDELSKVKRRWPRAPHVGSATAFEKAQFDIRVRWDQGIELAAHGVDADATLRTSYELFTGTNGLSRVRARHLYVIADAEVIEEKLTERAREKAKEVLAKIKDGTYRTFFKAAQRESEDSKTFKSGGMVRAGSPLLAELRVHVAGLAPGEIKGPVKTEAGFHLLQLDKRSGTRLRIRHILFRTKRVQDELTGEWSALPADVLDAAMAASREKAEAARTRLQDGERFAAVAKEITDETGSEAARDFPYLSPVARRVLELAKRLDERSDAMNLVSEPFEAAGYVHLLMVGEGSSNSRVAGLKMVKVWHVAKKGSNAEKELMGLRADLKGDLEDELEDEGGTASRGARPALVKLFEAMAEDESDAPTKAQGGLLGSVGRSEDLDKWGEAFADALYDTKPGQASGLVKGPNGYHIVFVEERVAYSFDEARILLAAGLLNVLSF